MPTIPEDEEAAAIPFIMYSANESRFEINPEAEEFLKKLVEEKIGVLAVVGKYRTGKSYLLNKLFLEKER